MRIIPFISPRCRRTDEDRNPAETGTTGSTVGGCSTVCNFPYSRTHKRNSSRVLGRKKILKMIANAFLRGHANANTRTCGYIRMIVVVQISHLFINPWDSVLSTVLFTSNEYNFSFYVNTKNWERAEFFCEDKWMKLWKCSRNINKLKMWDRRRAVNSFRDKIIKALIKIWNID